MKRVILLLLIFATPVAADVVHLKSGGKIEGRVEDLGTKYRIETDNGTVTIDKSDVVKIEKKAWEPKKKPDKKKDPKDKPRLKPKLTGSYAHPFLAFKIQFPAQWVRGKNHGKASCSFYGPKDVAYLPRVDLFVEVNKQSLADVVAKFKNGFVKAFDDVTFPFEEATQVRDQEGYQFSAKFTQGAVMMQCLWTFVSVDTRKYIMSFNCTAAWFDRYHKLIDATMKSIRVFALPTATKEEKEKYAKHYAAGEKAYSTRKYVKALSEFRKAAAVLPKWPGIHASIGTVCMRMKRDKDAEAAYTKAVELDPKDFSHQYNLGLCLLRLKKHDEALAALKKATELEPDSEPAQTNFGVACIAAGKYENAKTALEKSVELDPESAIAHYNLGLAYEGLDMKAEAIQQFQDTLKLDKRHKGAKAALKRIQKK